MSSEVLYRKWRPQRFADVAGQQPITTTLRNAVAAGSPAHAYLFTGPRGTGKTTTGRILAKAVNCTSPQEGEPCDTCASCEAFNSGRALDLIELDAASNRGIDEVRALREAAGYAPNSARYKVYLIDEVHMLTDAAFNALLKTLEEPPPHIIFILATTEAQRIPATILSRCQRFDFRRINLNAAVERLRTVAAGEGLEVAAGGLEAIARQATGSLRDGVNLLDQLVAYHGSNLDIEAVQRGLGLVIDPRTTDLARAAVNRDLASGLAVLASARDDGVELRAFVREVVNTLRFVLLLKAGAADSIPVSDQQASELTSIASGAEVGNVVAALRALGTVDFAGDPYDSLPAEVAFAALAVGLNDAPAARPMPSPIATAATPATTPSRPPERRGSPQGQQQRPRAASPQPPQPREGGSAPERPGERAVAAAESRPASAARYEPADTPEAGSPLGLLRGRWDSLKEAAREQYKKAGALLSSPSHVKSVDGDVVEIGFLFPAIAAKVNEDPKVLQALTEAAQQLLGRKLLVRAVQWDGLRQTGGAAPAGGGTSGGGAPSAPGTAGASTAPVAAAPAPSGRGGHLLEEALRIGAVRAEQE